MTEPIRIWTCAAHHPAFRCGGWAFVRAGQGPVCGAAGGERNTTARRMALAGLATALRDLPPGAGGGIDVATTSAELAALAGVLAGGAAPDAAEGDLDLLARIQAAAAGRRIAVSRVALDRTNPTAFAAAWAELAMDKAKATGAFSAAIPKPNLAKVPGIGGA
jgi:ribonuclease HI